MKRLSGILKKKNHPELVHDDQSWGVQSSVIVMVIVRLIVHCGRKIKQPLGSWANLWVYGLLYSLWGMGVSESGEASEL